MPIWRLYLFFENISIQVLCAFKNCCQVVGVLFIFWILTLYQMYNLQIFSFILWVSVNTTKVWCMNIKFCYSQLTYLFCFFCSLSVWIATNYGQFLKRWKYETTWPASWEICMQVKKQKLELDKEQQTVSKLGKEYVKAVCCHPAYLTYMQSTSCKMSGWIKHKLQSRLPGEITKTSDMQMTSHLWQKAKRN